MDLTLLTVTMNGSRTLPLAFEALAKQRCPDARFEVLVVDSSTDGSADLARSLIEKHGLDGRVVSESRLKITAFLAGVRGARAPLISMVDDDNVICEDFVQRSVNWFREHPELGILGSRNLPAIQNQPDWFRNDVLSWYACSTPSIDGIDLRTLSRPVMGNSGIIAGAGSTFRKAPMLAALEKGYTFFNDHRGEDTELCFLLESLGYRFAYDPGITLEHHVDPKRLSWKGVRSLCRGIGGGMLGTDAFFLTAPRRPGSRVAKWRNTWQWQAANRAKRLLRHGWACFKLAAGQHVGEMAVLRAEFDRGALRRILRERRRYTEHLRRMSHGPWTELRIR